MGAVLKLEEVRHSRGGREVLAIDALELDAGERLTVLGPNGAGKTTLLRLLAGLEAPSAGHAELEGVRVAGADLDVRRRIGYATQRPGLLSTSVIRNVELPLRWRGLAQSVRREAALAALDRLHVAHLAERKALSLSGGEAQRVSLARALAVEPQLLLLDEPASGLDAQAHRAFFDDLEAALADRATTVVHVTHRAEEALRLADRIAVLIDGTIRQLGDPASVLREPADATVARLLAYDNVLSVEVDQEAQVLINGVPCGITSSLDPGPATLAAWAAAVRISPQGGAPLRAMVERVVQGPGHWHVTLAAIQPLHAYLPLGQTPPRVGESVDVRVDPAHASVIRQSPRVAPRRGAQSAPGASR
jgi:ABC-type sulfate/molybdate transport systems ATPase subunit